MKSIYSVFTILMLLCLCSPLQAQNNDGEKLYQEALFYMEGMGNYAEAIEKFEKVARDHANNQPLAARALLMLGKCHEKLGRQEAKDAYNRIIENYSDQREVVLEARSRLLALSERTRKVDRSAMRASQLWSGDGVDNLGAPSPDGNYLSFVNWMTGDLAMRDLSTGENQNLTDKGSWAESSEFAEFSIFSPDGKSIVYAWYDDERLIYDLRVIDIDGSNERIIFNDDKALYVRPFDWSPDREHILSVISWLDRTNQIALISIEEKTVSVLKSLDWRSPEGMSFSPDGRYIAYDFPPFEDQRDRNIYLIDMEKQRETVLLDHQSENIVYGWSPDGSSLLFGSDRAGSNGIWFLPVKNGETWGEPELVKSDIGRHTIPMGFTKDGTFFYGMNSGGQDVYIASIDLTTGEIIGDSKRVAQRYISRNRNADWSPDGEYLAYVSQRELRFNRANTLVIHSMQTGQERALSPELNYFWRPRWSPDGKSITVTGADNRNRRGLYTIDVETGEVKDRIQGDTSEFIGNATLSPCGKYMYYLNNRVQQKDISLIQRNIETGEERKLYNVSTPRHYLSAVTVTPDAEVVLFNRNHDDGSKMKKLRVNSPDAEPEVLISFTQPEMTGPIISALDEQTVLFFKRLQSSDEHWDNELWKLNITNGQAEQLEGYDDERGMRPFDIRLHPDQGTIAFTRGQSNIEIWKLENFLPDGEVAGR